MRHVLAPLKSVFTGTEVALDLGTAFTRVHAAGRGLIAETPSLVASRERRPSRAGSVVDDPHRPGARPLRNGIVEDVGVARELLRPLLHRSRGIGFGRPRVLACAPGHATAPEREALIEAVRSAGASSVAVVPESLAAAIGAGLDVGGRQAQLVVDVGEGATEAAAIRDGAIVTTGSVRTACGDLRRAIREAIRRAHRIDVTHDEADRLLRAAVSSPAAGARAALVRGIDLATGRPCAIVVTQADLAAAVAVPLEAVVGHVAHFVTALPDDLGCEVVESGLCLTGGGARLSGLVRRLALATRLRVRVADDPLHAVVRGAAAMLPVAVTTGLFSR